MRTHSARCDLVPGGFVHPWFFVVWGFSIVIRFGAFLFLSLARELGTSVYLHGGNYSFAQCTANFSISCEDGVMGGIRSGFAGLRKGFFLPFFLLFSFSTCCTVSHSLLAYIVSAEKYSLLWISLYVTSHFLLTIFKVLFFFLTVWLKCALERILLC